MKIGTVIWRVALPAAFALAIVAPTQIHTSCPPEPLGEPQAQAHFSEPIPLRSGAVSGNEERSFSRLPARRAAERARDLMFREEDRKLFHAVQPFLIEPSAPIRIGASEKLRAAEEYRRFLLRLRSGASADSGARYQLAGRSPRRS